ncbi:MAG: glycosyltransferase family 9 protein [bacterium]
MAQAKGSRLNILVLRLGGIGDAVVSLPALRALRKGFPNSKITIACQSWLKEIFEGENIANEFIVYDNLFSAKTKDLFKPMAWKELFHLARRLLMERWDFFMAFHPMYSFKECLRPLLFSILSRAKRRIGMDSSSRGWFYHKRARYNRWGIRNYADILADTVELLEIEVKDRKPLIILSEGEREWARKFLEREGWKESSSLIGFCPTGRLKTKWWDWDRYLTVLKWIRDEHKDSKFLLTIGKGEDEAERFFVDGLGTDLILAKGLPIRNLASTIEKCNLFISNDTGPMHLAFAVGVPTIGLFGPGEWQRWAYNDENFFAIHHMVDCWPCYKDICDRGHICMKKITVEEVLEKVKEALEKKWKDRA